MVQAATAEMVPVALTTGEGTWLNVLGDLYRLLATGRDTNGAYAVLENKSFPQNGPPPHIHQSESESFYVMDGEFSFLCGDRSIRAMAGAFVHVPPGTLHTYKNVGNTPGRLLVVISPAGFERLFEEIGHPANDLSSAPAVDPAAIQKLFALAPQYGLEIRM